MWDEEIDEAARGLTSGEAGGEFRARVLARIGERPRARRFNWMPAAAAAAASLVLAVWMNGVRERRRHDSQHIRQVQEVSVVRGTEASRDGRGSRATPAAQGRDAPSVQTYEAQPAHAIEARIVTPSVRASEERASNAESAVSAAPESPLAPSPLEVAPIAIAAIRPAAPITIDEISTAPIEITHIDVPTLAQ